MSDIKQVDPKQVVYAPAEKFPCPWCAAKGEKNYINFTEELEDGRRQLIEGLAVDDWVACKACGNAVQVTKFEQRWFVAAKPAVGEKPAETDQPKEAEIVCPVCDQVTYDLDVHQGKNLTDEDRAKGITAPCPGKKVELVKEVRVEVECNLCGQKTFDLVEHQSRFPKTLEDKTTPHPRAGQLMSCPGKKVELRKIADEVEQVCPDCGAITFNMENHKRLSCPKP